MAVAASLASFFKSPKRSARALVAANESRQSTKVETTIWRSWSRFTQGKPLGLEDRPAAEGRDGRRPSVNDILPAHESVDYRHRLPKAVVGTSFHRPRPRP